MRGKEEAEIRVDGDQFLRELRIEVGGIVKRLTSEGLFEAKPTEEVANDGTWGEQRGLK